MNFTCQFCKSNSNKVYCKCSECQALMCSGCDFQEHLLKSTSSSVALNEDSFDFIAHKRVRICEECEEFECAVQCLNCEQFLCIECNSRLHQKGARQKHRRSPIKGQPDYITPKINEHQSPIIQQDCSNQKSNKQGSSMAKGSISGQIQTTGSESSRKNSHEQDYQIEHGFSSQQQQEEQYYQSHLGQQNYQQRENNDKKNVYQQDVRDDYGSSTRQGGRGNQTSAGHYLSSGKQQKNVSNHHYNQQYKESKGSGSCYSSSGASSAGSSNKASYQGGNYKQSEHYYNQYLGGSGPGNLGSQKAHNKYRKGSNQYYGESYNNQSIGSNQIDKQTGVLLNLQELIPPQYFDGDNVMIPEYQPYIKCEQYQNEMIEIQKELFEFARKGELLIDYEIFKENLISKIQISEKQLIDLIELAEEYNIIHQTKRNFANLKTLSFVSMQLDMISHECIFWILNSLRRDEMTPTERAVQSRIKEAFAFKICGQLWDCIMESITIHSQSEVINNKSQQNHGVNQESYSHRQVKVNNSQIKVVTVKELPKKMTQSKASASNSYNDYYTTQKQQQSYYQNCYYGSSQNSQYQYKQSYIYQSQLTEKQQTTKKVQQIPDKLQKGFQFTVKEIEEDPSIGQMTKVIYIKAEAEWIGVDQNTDDINFELYDELKTFLYNYFCNNQLSALQQLQEDTLGNHIGQGSDDNEEEVKWGLQSENTLNKGLHGNKQKNYSSNDKNSNQEIDFEEIRAIPGGRYGCAQFVKICGPNNLKLLSLGKLAQLVQYAVKEDVLRYHKTLLVWTTTVDKHKKLAEEMQKESQKNATVAAKLTVVKDALLEILAESKTGMSLAQLPLYLRRKLPFSLDLNELGFPKLKDLILSMSDKIKLELRGHNHPFAYLLKAGRYVHSSSNSDDFQSIPKNKILLKGNQHHLSEDINLNRPVNNVFLNEVRVKTVLTAFYNLMREIPQGIKSDEMPNILTYKVGFDFNFKEFGCHSLLEFLKKFIMPTIDIEILSNTTNENDVFIIRPKQFFKNYNYDAQAQQQLMGTFQQNMKNLTLEPTINQNVNMATNQTMNNTNIQYNMQQNNINKGNSISDQKNNNFYNNQYGQYKVQEQLARNDSYSSSVNQMYIPKAQSLYGGSVSSQQLNISHIRFNTADTDNIPQTSQNNINVNQIALNKQEGSQQFYLQQNSFNNSSNQQLSYYPTQKPPLPPQQTQYLDKIQSNLVPGMLQQNYINPPPTQQQTPYQNQKHNSITVNPSSFPSQQLILPQQQQLHHTSTFKTYPPQQISNYQNNQPQILNNQNQRIGFFLSPSQTNPFQINKAIEDQSSFVNTQGPVGTISPTSHSRAISLNQSVIGETCGGVLSTTSKSVSQDFSIQSQLFNNNTQNLSKNNQQINPSGFATPQLLHYNQFYNMPIGSRGGQYFQSNGDSIFGSPIPRSQQFESTSSQNQPHHYMQYNLEQSPPYNNIQEEEENGCYQEHNIKFIEKLVCDDDLDSRSGNNIDELHSQISNMHSPEIIVPPPSLINANALRMPNQNNFQSLYSQTTLISPQSINNLNLGSQSRQNIGQVKQKTWSIDMNNKVQGQPTQTASKGLLQNSNSCKNIGGIITEGGSSSSDENKRPSTVQEQKTEEDAISNNTSGGGENITNKYKESIINDQSYQKEKLL